MICLSIGPAKAESNGPFATALLEAGISTTWKGSLDYYTEV